MLRSCCKVLKDHVLSNKLQNLNCQRNVRAIHHHIVRVNHDQGKVRKEIDPNETYTDFEKSTAEWKYVEAILKRKTIPTPKNEPGPSGWRPVTAKTLESPYFIERTKFHMLPVYVKINEVGPQKYTVLRRIHGDIWKLEEDTKTYLSMKHEKEIKTLVSEFTTYIVYKGDFVEDLKEWLLNKGF